MSEAGTPVSVGPPSDMLIRMPAGAAGRGSPRDDCCDDTGAGDEGAAPAAAGSFSFPGRSYAVPVREPGSGSRPAAEALYRGFELVAAALLLLAALPVMAVGAALVRWGSPGPALFLHRRPGRPRLGGGPGPGGGCGLRPPPGGDEPGTPDPRPRGF